MKWSDIKVLEVSALEADLERIAEERRNIRFQEAIGPLENPMVKRNLRRDIARIKTAIAQKKNEKSET